MVEDKRDCSWQKGDGGKEFVLKVDTGYTKKLKEPWLRLVSVDDQPVQGIISNWDLVRMVIDMPACNNAFVICSIDPEGLPRILESMGYSVLAYDNRQGIIDGARKLSPLVSGKMVLWNYLGNTLPQGRCWARAYSNGALQNVVTVEEMENVIDFFAQGLCDGGIFGLMGKLAIEKDMWGEYRNATVIEKNQKFVRAEVDDGRSKIPQMKRRIFTFPYLDAVIKVAGEHQLHALKVIIFISGSGYRYFFLSFSKGLIRLLVRCLFSIKYRIVSFFKKYCGRGRFFIYC